MSDQNNLTQDTIAEEKKYTLTETEINILIEEAIYNTYDIEETMQRSEQFEGPIPHPEHMQQYKDIDSSFPDRIIKMAESNLTHKQDIEKIGTYGQIFMGFLGWLTPSGIAAYVLYNAVVFTQDNKSIEALIALVTAIATLGGAFYMKNRAK